MDDGIQLSIFSFEADSLKQADKVEETSENRVVLREQCKLLVTKHLISVEQGIDVSDNRMRDSMLKDFIDIKNKIVATRRQYEEAGFTFTKINGTFEKEETNEEDEDDIWEECDGKDSVKNVAPVTRIGTDSVKNVAPVMRRQHDNSLSIPSSSEANNVTSESESNKASSSKKGGSSGDSLRDKLISEAPVMQWGSQLSTWDSTAEARANHRGLDLDSHWGRVDQDAVIPADKIAELNLQATVYREERTETPPCHAPLKKGGLCQRRDLRVCPFHGTIVPRDDEGNPIVKESPLDESENKTSPTTEINEDVPMDETTLDSDPNQLAIQRKVAKQALKNIREQDKEEARKKAKLVKAKVKEHNFDVLRDAAIASTSRSAVIDEEFDRVFAARKNKKQTFSSRRKKTTAKDRISERLFSNRVKGTKPNPLPHGHDEKCRDTAANQW